jgi:hypothetical protein
MAYGGDEMIKRFGLNELQGKQGIVDYTSLQMSPSQFFDQVLGQRTCFIKSWL